MKKLIVILLGLVCSMYGWAVDNVVNVYNWSNYIPDSVLQEFTKETGIQVNYTTYDENETLYTKLKADPNIGYDVVFPSSYYVQRMAHEGMLHKLDKSQLSNIKNLNPLLLNKSYDPKNVYSLPYLWGAPGIIVNDKVFDPKTITSWSDLWQPRFKNQILLLDDIRDTFSVGLLALGYSINTTDPAQIKAAYEKLQQLMPNVKLFNNEGVIPIYQDEDASIGMILTGDANQVLPQNAHLHFVFPKDGIALSVDCMTIPKNAPHLKNAYQFINFIMRPDIAKEISMQLGYSTPNAAAIKLMPKEIQENTILNPPDSVLKNAQFENDVGTRAMAIYLHYWELLKLSA